MYHLMKWTYCVNSPKIKKHKPPVLSSFSPSKMSRVTTILSSNIIDQLAYFWTLNELNLTVKLVFKLKYTWLTIFQMYIKVIQLYIMVVVWWFSHLIMSDCFDPMDVVHQAPLSMGFPRQEYWSGLPYPLYTHTHTHTHTFSESFPV